MATDQTPSTEAPPPSIAPTGGRYLGGTVLGVVGFVTLVALVAMLRWDDWYVNFDGGIYLSLATNVRRGAGFVFPDGSFAGFRGPTYPTLIAGAWSILPDTARSAIWVSRAILVANALLVSLIAWRLSRKWGVALVAGLAVAVQPLALISGGLFFVPDGAVALFVLGAVLVFLWYPAEPPSTGRLLWVGALIGIAFLAKQTGALGGLIVAGLLVSTSTGGWWRLIRSVPALSFGFSVPVGAWGIYAVIVSGHGTTAGLVASSALLAGGAVGLIGIRLAPEGDPGSHSRPGLVVAGVFAAALAGLLVLGAATIAPIIEFWNPLRAGLLTQLYRDTPWALLLVPLVVAVGWGLARLRRDTAATGMLMTSVGFAGIVYAALTGAGFRNGLLVVYGLALLLAFSTGELWEASRHRMWWRSLAVVAVVLAVGASAVASEVTNGRLPEEELTAEGPAVVEAATWLSFLSPGSTAAGTPIYLSTLWRLALPHPILDIVPLHTIGRSEWEAGEDVFPNRVVWAGTVADPALLVDPIGIVNTRVQVAAFLEPTMTAYLRSERPDYVIVTGNTISQSAFDGGLLLQYLEESPSATPVYRSDEQALPQWVMIYEISYPFVNPETPSMVRRAADRPLDPIGPGDVVLSPGQYRSMVIFTLRRPLG